MFCIRREAQTAPAFRIHKRTGHPDVTEATQVGGDLTIRRAEVTQYFRRCRPRRGESAFEGFYNCDLVSREKTFAHVPLVQIFTCWTAQAKTEKPYQCIGFSLDAAPDLASSPLGSET